jgi:ubiquinone/menaquinone biosynthesis C-methylase UbiE
MGVGFSSRQIAEKYDRIAPWYDWVEGILNILGIGRLRRQLLRQSSGNVLEVAVGTGKNLAYYSRDCRIVALDLSIEMIQIARKRAATLSRRIFFLVADAEALPFGGRSFNTVVSSLSTCTFPNPVMALEEMARVCQTHGKVLLLEHGRSNRGWLGAWQDRHADQFAKPLGCHWNREPLKLARTAGLKIVEARWNFLGIFHRIEAKPPHCDERTRVM